MKMKCSVVVLCLIMNSGLAFGHEITANGVNMFGWQTEQIARVLSPAYSWNDLGVRAVGRPGESVVIQGDNCLRGHQFNIDVSDEFAYDIDENITLKLELELEPGPANILIAYDRNAGPGYVHHELSPTNHSREILTFSLPRSRLANRADYATDIKIVAQPGLSNFPVGPKGGLLTVCDIQIERSFTTPETAAFGWLALRIEDENRKPAAIRAGIYDETGRSALPSTEALTIKKFSESSQNLLLENYVNWPQENRFAFYMDGQYHVRLPVGSHRLIGSRGIEYHLLDEIFTIKAGQTLSKTIRLKRFANMPEKSWYSGDVHIHLARRDDRDGIAALTQITAEDLHVGNLLQMGNVAKTYFPQAGWGKEDGRIREGSHSIVSGQEDPRTARKGHTIHLNLSSPVRYPDHYLQYKKVFEEVSLQGGISGYAHVGFGGPDTLVGMALDVPTGLVKFAEIAQGGMIGTALWFDFLNLGYRIAPAAGTDYPYLGHPGAYRSYVHLSNGYSIDDWFAGLEKGHTFVTNGPLMDVNVNGAEMGDTLHLSRGETVKVTANVELLPDIDELSHLDLIVAGKVIASVNSDNHGPTLMLEHEFVATESAWLVVRAEGKRQGFGGTVAVSSPFYVVVDGQERTWNRDAVPGIVSKLTANLDALEHAALGPATEGWVTGPIWQETWNKQIEELSENITTAREELIRLSIEAKEAHEGAN